MTPRAPLRQVLSSGRQALGVLVLAIIVFVGIMGGIFTATEASAVAVVYAVFVGLFVYRQIGFKDLPRILVSAANTTAALSFVLAAAALFAWTLGIGRVPEVVTNALVGGTEALIAPFADSLTPAGYALLHRVLVLLVLNVALLLVGLVIDVAPALLIVVPVLLPVSAAIGMDSGLAAVHFGVMVVSNLIIGVVTPPVGTTLFVAAGVGRVPPSEVIRYIFPFLGVMALVQLLVTFVPAVTTALPSLM